MPKTKIAFHLELLIEDAPAEVLAAALKAVTAQLAKSSDPTQANGEIAGEDGSLRWQVRAWPASEVVRCIGCGREVASGDCDITADGERCSACSLAGEVANHIDEAHVNASMRGYVSGTLGVPPPGARLIHILQLLA
jgi:hypothetical protein